MTFFRTNKQEAVRTGAFSAADFYITNFAYLVVPLAFGLGAPTIILDTTFKIFRGTVILYAAGSDVAVPKQTRALADKDQKTLVRATLMAAALCSLPALALCALLFFASTQFFALLLGPAATMPARCDADPDHAASGQCRADGVQFAASAHRLFPAARD